MFRGFLCAVALLFLFSILVSKAQAQLYAVSPFFSAGSLYRLDTSTGTSNLVGPLSNNQLELVGIGFDTSGRLLTIDANTHTGAGTRKLWQIDTNTGAVSQLFDFDTRQTFFEGDFSIDPGTNLGYMVEESDVHRIDLTTGARTELGPLIYNGQPMYAYTNVDGLAFRNGELYGIITILTPGLNGHLVKINKDTLEVTDVGATGLDMSSVAGLAYNPSSDRFYLATGTLPGLYSVDPLTGAATLIGNHNLAHISGLAYIPDPASASCFCVGAIYLAVLRRPRRFENTVR